MRYVVFIIIIYGNSAAMIPENHIPQAFEKASPKSPESLVKQCLNHVARYQQKAYTFITDTINKKYSIPTRKLSYQQLIEDITQIAAIDYQVPSFFKHHSLQEVTYNLLMPDDITLPRVSTLFQYLDTTNKQFSERISQLAHLLVSQRVSLLDLDNFSPKTLLHQYLKDIPLSLHACIKKKMQNDLMWRIKTFIPLYRIIETSSRGSIKKIVDGPHAASLFIARNNELSYYRHIDDKTCTSFLAPENTVSIQLVAAQTGQTCYNSPLPNHLLIYSHLDNSRPHRTIQTVPRIFSCALSSDGTLLAAYTESNDLHIINVDDPTKCLTTNVKHALRYSINPRILRLVFSPDNNYLVATIEGIFFHKVHAWQIVPFKRYGEFHCATQSPSAITISPDSAHLFLVDQQDSSIYGYAIKNIKRDYYIKNKTSSPITAIASGSLKEILATAHRNGVVHVWSLITQQPLHTLFNPFKNIQIPSLLFTSDGTQIIAAYNEEQAAAQPAPSKSHLCIWSTYQPELHEDQLLQDHVYAYALENKK